MSVCTCPRPTYYYSPEGAKGHTDPGCPVHGDHGPQISTEPIRPRPRLTVRAERPDMTRAEILREVSAERDRQNAKWGGIPGTDRRDDATYAAVLGEEFGEACQAWLQRKMPELREELIQPAAVAVAWIEELDNGGSKPRP